MDQNNIDLTEIKARTEDATGGNWEVRQPRGGDAWIGTDEWKGVVGVVAKGMDRRDADFVAHAREDVPALVGEVERLRSLVGVLEGVLGWTRGHFGDGVADEIESELQERLEDTENGESRG